MKQQTIHQFLSRTILVFTILFMPSSASSGSGHAQETASLHVNLQEFPLYLKRGFDPHDTVQPDVHDGSWLKKFPFSNVIVSKLGLPGLPERVFLSPFAKPEEEFTFAIPFTCKGARELASERMPGLFLAGIGDNWQIYLNGTLVRSEMHLKADTLGIRHHRSQRSLFFPLPPQFFQDGDNLLVFRIVGDPTDKTVGFQYSAPFYIGVYKDMVRENDETLAMILIGGYLLVAVYHFLLFFIRRKDTHNFFCGLFSALMGLYYLSRTHSIYHYIPDTSLVVKIEFFCIFLVIAALGAFVETLCVGKISLVTKLYSALFVFLAVSQTLLPRPYGSDALIVWQIAGIAALLHILLNNIIRVFLREVRETRKEHALRHTKAPGLGYFLVETYAGNLLIGMSIVVVSAIVDIFDSLLFHYTLNLTSYSLYFFVMTVTLMLARIYGKLNNALQAKRVFLANMSHEVRTPMNAIMGMVEQIIRADPPEAIRGKAEQIKQAGNILISIINDILDFSRLEAGKIEIINREYRFRPLIDEVEGIIAMQLAGKDVTFTTRIDPAIPETLVGDALRIRQVLLNLLWNAVKFTGRGSIEFSAALQDAAGPPTLVFTVSDTGRGIPRKNLESIFTEFYQMDSRLRQNTEGAGLGLSICKSLCLLMGGAIRVRSEYGLGSVFTVILPQQPGNGNLAVEEARQSALLERGLGFQDARALIVDDLESNRQVILGLLAPYGLELHTAANGRKALELAASRAYDIIFMDHVMEEGLDGVAAAKALRQLPGHGATPVVALTANAMRGMREFFLEHGFQDYISKPIDPLLLDAVLAAWLPQEKRAPRSALSFSRADKEIYGGAVRAELMLQRLELLNHYRWHFVNTLPTDAAYCQKFSAVLEDMAQNSHISAPLREAMAKLAKAGRQADVQVIRQSLPDVYAALAKFVRDTQDEFDVPDGLGNTAEQGRGQGLAETVNSLLPRLEEVLEKGDAAGADSLMAQLRDIPSETLPGSVRELYFLLYDALMLEQTEKALGALALWRKAFGHKA